MSSSLTRIVYHCQSPFNTTWPNYIVDTKDICHSKADMWYNFFWVKRVPGQGPEQRESVKTVIYLLIVIIILIRYIIIKLLIKKRTIPAKTGNGTFNFRYFWIHWCLGFKRWILFHRCLWLSPLKSRLPARSEKRTLHRVGSSKRSDDVK